MIDEEFPTSIEWLKLLKSKKNNCSDYQLAKYLGVSQQAISNIMLGKNVMSDTTAVKVAKELGFSPLLLIVSVMRERSNSQEINDILDKIPKDVLKASCYILIGFSLSLLHFPAVLF